MAPLKVLICGGGIAGNCLAFWLSKSGHNVTVLERFPNIRSTGLQLDLRGHGIEVIKRMGLEQAFRDNSVDEQGWEVVDETGKRKAYFPVNRTGKGVQNFSSEYEIMRGDLCRLLYDACKDRANFVFGKTVESFEQTDQAVEVLFSDGQKEKFDLLVGADGQGSRTRRLMLEPGVKDPVASLNSQIAYCTVPWPAKEGDSFNGRFFLATDGRVIFLRRHSPKYIQAYLIHTRRSERLEKVRRGDVEAEKAVFDETFRGAGWITDEVLEAVKLSEDFYCERLGVVELDPWYKGRVAVVGDAAYSPTTMTGMGTTCAIVGAYVLAGEIQKHCPAAAAAAAGSDNSSSNDKSSSGLAAAFEGYEQNFRPFMKQVQHGVADGSPITDWFFSSKFRIGIATFLLGVASRLSLDSLSRFFLRETIKNWSLPDYEGLKIDQKESN